MQTLDINVLINMSRAEAIKLVQATSEIPPLIKMALAGGLAMMNDRDYAHYSGLLVEALTALGESERGRRVLAEVGLGQLVAN